MTDSKKTDVIDDKITTVVKTKDPKKVEAGKKLAAISKAAKEKKMREKIMMEKEINAVNSDNKKYIIAASVVVSIVVMYLMRSNKPAIVDRQIRNVEVNRQVKKESSLENL